MLFPIRRQINLCLCSSPILKILTSISCEKFNNRSGSQNFCGLPPQFVGSPTHITVSQSEPLLRLLRDLPHQTQGEWDGKRKHYSGLLVSPSAFAPPTQFLLDPGPFRPANTSLRTGTWAIWKCQCREAEPHLLASAPVSRLLTLSSCTGTRSALSVTSVLHG